MKLFLIEDENFTRRYVVRANTPNEALEKLCQWYDKKYQDEISNRYNWVSSRDINWEVDEFDYDDVIS